MPTSLRSFPFPSLFIVGIGLYQAFHTGNGWTNKEEDDAGTDPLLASDHPPEEETPFWNEIWFWGLAASVAAVTMVAIPASVKRRRQKKVRQEFQRMNENFALTQDVSLFVSYSHADAAASRIPMIMEYLRNQVHIATVVYSQKDTKDDFIAYMNEQIGQADGVLLFCSKTSAKSKFVNPEWMAAMAADKPVIPIFLDKGEIPPLLKGKLGVEFNAKKVEDSTAAIYAVVKKQRGEPKGKTPKAPKAE